MVEPPWETSPAEALTLTARRMARKSTPAVEPEALVLDGDDGVAAAMTGISARVRSVRFSSAWSVTICVPSAAKMTEDWAFSGSSGVSSRSV